MRSADGFRINNARHSKAVISQSVSEPWWYKEEDGLIYGQGDYSGGLLVYGKRHGKWKRLAAEAAYSGQLGFRRKIGEGMVTPPGRQGAVPH